MSRVALDKVLETKGFRVAALVATEVGGQHFGRRLGFWGTKAPVGFLIGGAGGVQGFDAAGRVLDEAAVEALAPGAWARFAQGES